MPTPQANTVVPPKPPQELVQEMTQELAKKAKAVDDNLNKLQEDFNTKQSSLEAAQIVAEIAQIEAEIASAALDKERRIEKARPPFVAAEKALADARKQFEESKGLDPQRIATLEKERDSKTAQLEQKQAERDTAVEELKKAEGILTKAKTEKEAKEKAYTDLKQLLDKAEAELTKSKDDQAKLSLDERAKAQDAWRAWKKAESEHKEAEARLNADNLEAEKEYAKFAREARKRQLDIVKALPSKPSPTPAPVAG